MPGEPTREPTYSEFVISSLNVRTNRMEAQANGRRSVAGRERESGRRGIGRGTRVWAVPVRFVRSMARLFARMSAAITTSRGRGVADSKDTRGHWLEEVCELVLALAL